MNTLPTRLLRAAIVFLFIGVLIGQIAVLPEISGGLADRYPEAAHLRQPALVVSIVGLAAAQVVLVCIWRLLTLVRREAIFAPEAFRWVDLIWAAVAACALAFGLLLWLTERTLEFGMQPGVALILLGCAVLAGGVALLVGVLRTLLARAVGLKEEATTLRSELDEVI